MLKLTLHRRLELLESYNIREDGTEILLSPCWTTPSYAVRRTGKDMLQCIGFRTKNYLMP